MTIHEARLGVALTALFTFALAAQERREPAPAEPPPTVEAARKKLLDDLREQGIVVDRDAETVTIPCVVNRVMDPLEYLLINERGKRHEALFVTRAKPSILNSAFLLLGFVPGKNATTEPIEPEPTEEEVANGAEFVRILPPEGMRLWITVSWTRQDEGKTIEHDVPVEDLLLDLTTGKPIEDVEWIYLGGQTAPLYRNDPPVFVADYEGNLISTCYMAPENHLVTIKHARARDDQNWWRTAVCPEDGVEVSLRFHKREPAIVRAREAARQVRPKSTQPGKDE